MDGTVWFNTENLGTAGEGRELDDGRLAD